MGKGPLYSLIQALHLLRATKIVAKNLPRHSEVTITERERLTNPKLVSNPILCDQSGISHSRTIKSSQQLPFCGLALCPMLSQNMYRGPELKEGKNLQRGLRPKHRPEQSSALTRNHKEKILKNSKKQSSPHFEP